MALKTNNKLQFIDDTLPRPDAIDPSFGAWGICHILVLLWQGRQMMVITSSLDDTKILANTTNEMTNRVRIGSKH
ncbi:hypothetical protein Lal_00019667 [Lupinus albus]|nr:hypothetical protein Lal_00019667 [Lupinus albus]